MAKKSRRQRRAARQAGISAPAPVVMAPKAAAASEPKTATALDFAKEYPYVVSDLKRIAILAASILVVFIALTFVIK